ncbi:thioredoxin family protein [Neolewinella persica]|uniref:thioredoxin family protein n=1 Tax=Neolewinella persica TaxID=70998 RepID=UPI000476F752|nr:thioredoxin family protein [Neolewinella persica]
MKIIEILGTGCPKCKQTTAVVEKAVEELGLNDVSIEKVEDIMKILEYSVMSTPTVVINGEIKIKGRVPSVTELKELLKQ